MKLHKLEIRRQIIHLIYGPVLISLYEYHIINLEIIFGMIIGGIIMSLMIKKKRLSPIRWVLSHFERERHLENFPGKGILFFTIGTLISLILFDKNIAYASILVLSVGDSISNIIGRHFGKIKTKLNPHKYIEGTLVGIIFCIPIVYYFSQNILAAISTSFVAMFLETPNITILNIEIDDNLLIPIGAGLCLNLFK